MSVTSNPIAYKESGIPWIGKIPEHWEVRKIKQVARIVTGKTPSEESNQDWGNDLMFITPTDCLVGKKYVSSSARKLSQEGIKNFASIIVPKDSVLVSCIASIGKVAVNSENTLTNQQINTVVPNKNLSSTDFLYYQLLTAMPFVEKYFCGYSTLPIINKGDFSNVPIVFPSLQEQQTIADFLDKKTQQIEDFIAKKQKLIALLEEKKQTLINQCVTQGFDPSIPLKDSGVEWLGQIPTHWEVRKLKYVASLRNQKEGESDFKIGLENIESKTGKFIPTNESVFDNDGIGFFEGDVLFGKLRPYLAKVFLADKNGICVGEFLVLKSEGILNRFLKFLMLSGVFIEIVNSSTYGTKMPRANWEFIGNLKIPLPPLEEQKIIAEYLDTQIEKIDCVISKIKSQINLIKEYKTTLISEAVCGRVEIN